MPPTADAQFVTMPSALPPGARTTAPDPEDPVVARAVAIAGRAHTGRRLPAMARLLERLRSGCSARELAGIVQASPDLAARVLRLANSAAYAPLRPIASLDRAIAFIGNDALRQIVLVTALIARVAETHDRDVRLAVARLNADAVRTATVARWLAVRSGRREPGEAFTLGLVAELGQVELVEHGGAPYAALALGAPDPDATAGAEIDLVGTTHEAVGRVLAETWGLPEPVRRVMAGHHAPGRAPTEGHGPEPDPDDPVQLVRAAAWLVRDRFSPSAVSRDLTADRSAAALGVLGLDPRTTRTEVETLRPMVAELLTIFHV